MARSSIPEKAIIQALRVAHGNISLAAEKLGCERRTIYNHIEKNPRLQGELDNARETLLDMCESMLDKLAAEGNFQAIKFLLSTRGKSRGFTTRMDVPEANSIGSITITCGLEPLDKVVHDNREGGH